MSETIKEIHAAIFGGPNDYEGQGINPNDVTIKLQDLLEYQGQGIAPQDGRIYMDRDSRLICEEVVKDLKHSFPYSPFQHARLYRTKGRCNEANIYWKCKHCNFFSELLDQYLIEYHLCCSCEIFSIEEKNALKLECKKRAQKHLIDLNC